LWWIKVENLWYLFFYDYLCVQGGCEEGDAIASPGDEETPLINDGEYEDREEKCEGDFDGHGSPVNDSYGRQGMMRTTAVPDYSAHSMLLQGDECATIVRDRVTNGGVTVRSDVDQPEHDDTDMEERGKEETDEHVHARESSVDED
jgi:hypothetical protein